MCIILVTILVRLAMMPVSRRQQASMARTQEAMAKLKPEIAKLKEKYKNDLVAKQQAQMELYRKHGVNPAAGLGGCLMLFCRCRSSWACISPCRRASSSAWSRSCGSATWPPRTCSFWWVGEDPVHQRPGRMGSFFYLGPYFNLLPVIAAGADVLPDEVHAAAAGRRADGPAAEDDAVHHDPDVRVPVLQDAGGAVPVLHLHARSGAWRSGSG